jgi:hypothetical protein
MCTFGTACVALEACLDIIHLFLKMKMDDTQTWMILLRKRWIRPRGRPGKKKARSTFVLHAVTTMGRYIMSGSWEEHGMDETGKRERSSDGGHCDVHELPLLRSTLASPIRQPLLSQGIYPGQFSEQCLVWRFLFRS